MNTFIKTLIFLPFLLFSTIAFAQVTQEQLKGQLKANGINLSDAELKQATKVADGIDAEKQAAEKKAKLAQQPEQVQPQPQAPKDNTPKSKEGGKDKAGNIVKKPTEGIGGDIQQNVEEGIMAGKTQVEALTDAVMEAKNEKALPKSPIYGHHLYRQRNISAISDGVNMKAADSYVLGVGDEISVNVWGRAEFSGSQKINEDGYVKFFQMPRLYLKGMTYKQAQDKIEGQFKQSYNLNTSQIAVSLNYSRTITVNVVGEVMSPRSYTISAINTAVNALAAADGPTDIGSVRNIRLSSAGKPDRILDLYKFLLNPLSSEAFFITNNDYIYVPPVGKIVGIQGAINRPFKYELLESENLKSLLQWAGGLTPNAFKGNLQLRRFENDQVKILTINLNDIEKIGGDFALKAGDVLVVPSIDGGYEETTKKVTIQGAVKKPSTYDLLMNEGLRVLIGKAGGLSVNTYTGNFQVRRVENNEMKLYDVSLKELDSLKTDFALVKGDIVTMTSIDPDYYTNFADIAGAVKLPGRYQVEKGKTRLLDFLNKAELKDDANTPLIYLSRVQPDLSRLSYRINLEKVLKNPSSPENLLLASKDEIFILSKSNFIENYNITITGSVRNPGIQPLSVNTNLADVLFRAGGLTIDADRRKIEISRLQIINGDLRSVTVKTMELAKTDTLYIKNDSIANYKLQPFDQIMVRKMPNFEMIENIVINGEVKYPGIYAILGKTERISDIIQRAGGLTLAAEKSDAIMTRTQEGAGYVILDLDKALQNPRSAFNYIAKGGDVITIPRAREMVSVEGAVEYPEIELLKRISMSYNPGRGVTYYINEYAGGVSEEKRGRYYLTKVRYPNGTLKATKSYFFHLIKIYPRVRPGSIITVGTKALKDKDPNNPEEKPKEKVDWEGFAQKSLAAITTVFTLLLLSQTVTGSSR